MSYLVSVDAEEFKTHPEHDRLSKRGAYLVDGGDAFNVYRVHSLGRGDDGRIYFEPESDESAQENLVQAIEALLPEYADFVRSPTERIAYTVRVHAEGRSTDIPQNIKTLLREEPHLRWVNSD